MGESPYPFLTSPCAFKLQISESPCPFNGYKLVKTCIPLLQVHIPLMVTFMPDFLWNSSFYMNIYDGIEESFYFNFLMVFLMNLSSEYLYSATGSQTADSEKL